MRDMMKLVLKTAAITLSAIVFSIVAVLFLLSFTAPAAMAKFTVDIGLYDQCAFFDSIAYADGEGKIDYIAEAFACSARTENYKKIIKYGNLFIADDGFADYCTAKEEWEKENYGEMKESYAQYVYGSISVAYYHNGEESEALELAMSVNKNKFDKYNAITDLVREVILSTGNTGDKTFAREILHRLETLRNGGTIDDVSSLNEMIRTLTQYTEK